ncbi:F-box domain-containing protein [Orpheovirus IHUMI-LCC2]|uniref:F-box domain-containing protein n=1 Tax=Orpheovirus IHUMI-LCC2 TaxID=2023057 RepID=A0A2I2L480_9VIRU|nr:F-box domain-containing protein [Orpheovirus IHUMI-LCC2]SNW62346.1 F-box domain-containing protein [Orpheovirus IHUMI-LCC2]
MEVLCEDTLVLIFEYLDGRALYRLRKVNKWIRLVLDSNPKLFWYKHYDIYKIKPYIYNYDYTNKYYMYMILCNKDTRINIEEKIEHRYMISYCSSYNPIFPERLYNHKEIAYTYSGRYFDYSYPTYNLEKTIVFF